MTNPTPASPREDAQKPESPLLAFILAVLTPLLTVGSVIDLHLARLAAQEAIAAYTTRGQNDLIGIAQITAFALAALDNLRLSMPAELSLSMKLKLRGNANALNKAGREATRTLGTEPRPNQPLPARSLKIGPAGHIATAMPPRPETPPATPPATLPAHQSLSTDQPLSTDTTQPAASRREHQDRLHWATAMKAAAARLQAQAANVSSAQRRTDARWIQALTGVARDLIPQKAAIPAPAGGKSDLPRSTLMAANADFPAHLVKPTRG